MQAVTRFGIDTQSSLDPPAGHFAKVGLITELDRLDHSTI